MKHDLAYYTPFYKRSKLAQADFIAGLIEGDGSIAKNEIRVSFDLKDRIVAENFVYTFGGLITDSNDNRAQWIINGDCLKKILNLVNGPFVGSQKVNDLRRCFPKMEIKPPLLKVRLKSAWLSGFMESDGSIGISMERKENGSLTSPTLYYTFSQRNPELLNLIKQSSERFVEQKTPYKQSAKNAQGVVRNWQGLSFRRFVYTSYLCEHFLKFPFLGRKHFQNLKAKEVLDLVVKGTHLSVKGRETAFALRQASRNQTLPDDIRVNYVVKSASRTRITLTLEQMQYIDLRLSQGVKQTQIARERVGED